MSNKEVLPDKPANLPREARKTSDTTIDRIYKYYHDRKRNIQLTEKEEEIRQRLDELWKLRCAPYSREECRVIWQRRFGLSTALFYLDWKQTEIIFTNPEETSNDTKRGILNNILLSTMRKARKENDFAAVEKLAGRYAAINRLDQEDNAVAEILKKLKPHTIVITSDPEVLKQQAEELMKNIPGTEDVDYEDVSDETETD